MAHALVTGGTGFIGRELVRVLLERGERVRCVVTPWSRRAPLPPGAEVVSGDVTKSETLDPALDGVDVVYHLAGLTRARSARDYAPVNAGGAKGVAEAAARCARPPVVVFTSSLAAAGPSRGDRPRRESDPPEPVSEYGRSKLQGELWLRAAADRVPVTVLRPTGVLGPGDPNHLPMFVTVRYGINVIAGPRGARLMWVHTDDLIAALLLAAERGRRLEPKAGPADPRGVYFVAADEPITLTQAGRLAADAVGRRGRVVNVRLPDTVARLLGRLNNVVTKLTPQPRLLILDKVNEGLAGSWTCDTTQAREELGFTCRVSLADGFRREAEWYRAQGWLK